MKQLHKKEDMMGKVVKDVRYNDEGTSVAIHFEGGTYIIFHNRQFWDEQPLGIFEGPVKELILPGVRYQLGLLDAKGEAEYLRGQAKLEELRENEERAFYERLKEKYEKDGNEVKVLTAKQIRKALVTTTCEVNGIKKSGFRPEGGFK